MHHRGKTRTNRMQRQNYQIYLWINTAIHEAGTIGTMRTGDSHQYAAAATGPRLQDEPNGLWLPKIFRLMPTFRGMKPSHCGRCG